MRIKMLIGCAGPDVAYSNGHEYDVTKEVGEDLVRAGHAFEITTRSETASVKPIETAKKK
jgi:hypothetical protein